MFRKLFSRKPGAARTIERSFRPSLEGLEARLVMDGTMTSVLGNLGPQAAAVIPSHVAVSTDLSRHDQVLILQGLGGPGGCVSCHNPLVQDGAPITSLSPTDQVAISAAGNTNLPGWAIGTVKVGMALGGAGAGGPLGAGAAGVITGLLEAQGNGVEAMVKNGTIDGITNLAGAGFGQLTSGLGPVVKVGVDSLGGAAISGASTYAKGGTPDQVTQAAEWGGLFSGGFSLGHVAFGGGGAPAGSDSLPPPPPGFVEIGFDNAPPQQGPGGGLGGTASAPGPDAPPMIGPQELPGNVLSRTIFRKVNMDVAQGDIQGAIDTLKDAQRFEGRLLQNNPNPEFNGGQEQIQGRWDTFQQEINRLQGLQQTDGTAPSGSQDQGSSLSTDPSAILPALPPDQTTVACPPMSPDPMPVTVPTVIAPTPVTTVETITTVPVTTDPSVSQDNNTMPVLTPTVNVTPLTPDSQSS